VIRSEAFLRAVLLVLFRLLLISDVDAFYLEHRRCGELDGDVAEEGANLRMWMICTCGAHFSRIVSLRESGPPERP
jgi:hypothetical protein